MLKKTGKINPEKKTALLQQKVSRKILKLKSMSNCTEYTPNWSALTRMVFPQQDDP